MTTPVKAVPKIPTYPPTDDDDSDKDPWQKDPTKDKGKREDDPSGPKEPPERPKEPVQEPPKGDPM